MLFIVARKRGILSCYCLLLCTVTRQNSLNMLQTQNLPDSFEFSGEGMQAPFDTTTGLLIVGFPNHKISEVPGRLHVLSLGFERTFPAIDEPRITIQTVFSQAFSGFQMSNTARSFHLEQPVDRFSVLNHAGTTSVSINGDLLALPEAIIETSEGFTIASWTDVIYAACVKLASKHHTENSAQIA